MMLNAGMFPLAMKFTLEAMKKLVLGVIRHGWEPSSDGFNLFSSCGHPGADRIGMTTARSLFVDEV